MNHELTLSQLGNSLPTDSDSVAAHSAIRTMAQEESLASSVLIAERSATLTGVAMEVLTLESSTATQLLAHTGPLWDEWSTLWQQFPPTDRDPCTHPVWLTAWLKQYVVPAVQSASQDVRLFVLRRDGKLLCVLPLELVSRQTWLGKRWTLLAPSEVPLEGGSVAIAAEDLPQLIQQLLNTPLELVAPSGKRRRVRPDRVRFDQVDETHALIQRPGLQRTLDGTRPRAIIPAFSAGDSTDCLGHNFRRTLRKSRERWEKLPGARIEECTEAADLKSGLARLAALEAKSWKGERGTDLQHDRQLFGFFETILQGCAPTQEAVIRILTGGGKDLAAQLCLISDGVLQIHKIGYDEEASHVTPGNLLMEQTLREFCPQRGLRGVSLVTYHPWNDRWRPGLLQTHAVELYPTGVRGWVSRYLCTSPKSLCKRVLQKFGALSFLRRVKSFLRKA